jgi:hypothetical protein
MNLEELLLLVMFGPEDEGCAVLQSAGNHMPVGMSDRFVSSVTPLQ